jgi:hypothetical protein
VTVLALAWDILVLDESVNFRIHSVPLPELIYIQVVPRLLLLLLLDPFTNLPLYPSNRSGHDCSIPRNSLPSHCSLTFFPQIPLTMSAPNEKISIAICGGGISGLSVAIGLLRYPHLYVHIYESAPAFAEIGAGVSFGPNAMRAMSLIDPNILRGYDRRRTENDFQGKKDAWFDFRWGMDVRGRKAGDWFHATISRGTGQSSIYRVSLNCACSGGGS